MEDVSTIDAAGRLVVPKAMRDHLQLKGGSRVRLREDGARIVIEPILDESIVAEVDGLPVIRGRLGGPAPDHRTLRAERIASRLPRR